MFVHPVFVTALLDRLLHRTVVFQIEGSRYRLRWHADLLPEYVRTKASTQPAPIRRSGRWQKNGGADLDIGSDRHTATGQFTSALLDKLKSALHDQDNDPGTLFLFLSLVCDRSSA